MAQRIERELIGATWLILQTRRVHSLVINFGIRQFIERTSLLLSSFARGTRRVWISRVQWVQLQRRDIEKLNAIFLCIHTYSIFLG